MRRLGLVLGLALALFAAQPGDAFNPRYQASGAGGTVDDYFTVNTTGTFDVNITEQTANNSCTTDVQVGGVYLVATILPTAGIGVSANADGTTYLLAGNHHILLHNYGGYPDNGCSWTVSVTRVN